MTLVHFFVLMAMGALAPDRDHSDLADAITTVVESERPLFASDEDHLRTASLMVAIAFRESSFRNDAVGDHGRSVCAFQIHGGSHELLEDPVACVKVAFRMLRESVHIDRENPVAFYCRGPRYQSDEARRLSRDRMRLARRLLGEVR